MLQDIRTRLLVTLIHRQSFMVSYDNKPPSTRYTGRGISTAAAPVPATKNLCDTGCTLITATICTALHQHFLCDSVAINGDAASAAADVG